MVAQPNFIVCYISKSCSALVLAKNSNGDCIGNTNLTTLQHKARLAVTSNKTFHKINLGFIGILTPNIVSSKFKQLLFTQRNFINTAG